MRVEPNRLAGTRWTLTASRTPFPGRHRVDGGFVQHRLERGFPGLGLRRQDNLPTRITTRITTRARLARIATTLRDVEIQFSQCDSLTVAGP